METIEQDTTVLQQTPSASPRTQRTEPMPRPEIFVNTVLCICFLATLILGFRTVETALPPLYRMLKPRQELIWDWEGRPVPYTPYAWFVKIKQGDRPREYFSIETRDSIRAVPAFLGDIPTLKYLSISYQPIRTLPDTIGNLTNLRDISVTNTLLSAVPESIGNLTNLQTLSLQGNRLTSLPDSIGNLANLSALSVAYNRISSLPPSIANLSNLSILDLTANGLHTFPVNLPPHLGALFLGGNPIPRTVIDARERVANYSIFY